MTRRLLPTLLVALSAGFFGFGTLIAARLAAGTENEQIAALRAELVGLKRQRTETASGTSGRAVDSTAAMSMGEASRASLIADITRQLRREMGLLPLRLLRERRSSFVELYSYDSAGSSNYGTAGYLGNGYFITVKHGVVALGEDAASRPITAITLMNAGRATPARLIDTGDANICRPSISISATASNSRSRSSVSATTTRKASFCRRATSASARQTIS